MTLLEVSIQKWKCDKCDKEEYAKRLPQGWIVLDRNLLRKEVEHECEQCESKGEAV